MRKTFMGVRLKTLRKQRGMTQAALARALDLSPSYVNQLENNQRPLSVPVLLKLQAQLDIDLQFFSEDEQARLLGQLQDVVHETAGKVAERVSDNELQTVAQQMPALAKLIIHLQQRANLADNRLQSMSYQMGLEGREGEYQSQESSTLKNESSIGVWQQPHEEVRDFFYAYNNHIESLDRLAERLYEEIYRRAYTDGSYRQHEMGATDGNSPPLGQVLAIHDLAQALQTYLQQEHGVVVLDLPHMHIQMSEVAVETGNHFKKNTLKKPLHKQPLQLRRYDAKQKILWLSPLMTTGQRAFQLATQLAYFEAEKPIGNLVKEAGFNSPQAGSLARIGLASYFAGALILPYSHFLQAAQAVHYDIDILGLQFGVSFETVCHRLSTLQRPQQRGIPFFFIRVDRAGNISKRQSATDFHFSRAGGTCPLWNVYEAFSQPGRVIVQLASLPDGRVYLWMANYIHQPSGGYGSSSRDFSMALGCDVRYADQLIYAKGLDLSDLSSATPIGPGCKVCERTNCHQRAFPALGRELSINENERLLEPYV